MQKVTKRNIALAIIFLLILVVVALLIGNFTFSYLGADVSDDVTTQGETTASGDTIIFSKDNDLNLQASKKIITNDTIDNIINTFIKSFNVKDTSECLYLKDNILEYLNNT